MTQQIKIGLNQFEAGSKSGLLEKTGKWLEVGNASIEVGIQVRAKPGTNVEVGIASIEVGVGNPCLIWVKNSKENWLTHA